MIELILDTTNVLLHQCLFKKDGWKIVEEVLSVLYACTMYFQGMVALERKLLYDVLESLMEELRRLLPFPFLPCNWRVEFYRFT